MPLRPTVVLTRPLADALHWQQLLQSRQLDSVVLPLIEIRTCHDSATLAALEQLRTQLAQYRALMFVSSNAVEGFLQAPGMAPALLTALHNRNTRAWAPGPGTARALQQAGIDANAIDSPSADAPQMDSESLWSVVGHQLHPGDRVLIVRGASAHGAPGVQGSGREWLGQQLRARQCTVDFIGVYTRQCPANNPELLSKIEQLQAQQALWLFSSSEAIAHLQQLAPHLTWQRQQALTTHPRIAQAARAAGFGDVRECKPDVNALCASIESAS